MSDSSDSGLQEVVSLTTLCQLNPECLDWLCVIHIEDPALFMHLVMSDSSDSGLQEVVSLTFDRLTQ